MKIWLKTIVGEKIVKSHVMQVDDYRDDEINSYVEKICNEIDEPTPLFLQKHFQHIRDFHNTHFTSIDFVESVYFDSMNIQVFDEKDQKQKENRFYV